MATSLVDYLLIDCLNFLFSRGTAKTPFLVLPKAQDPARIAGGSHLSLHRPEAGGERQAAQISPSRLNCVVFAEPAPHGNSIFEKSQHFTFEPIEISIFKLEIHKPWPLWILLPFP